MKLVAQIRLLPDSKQAIVLKQTLETVNAACNRLSEIAWKEKKFGQIPLHNTAYYSIKETFKLSAQVTVRAISKVADAYKVSKDKQRVFRKHGAITYDDRILRFKIQQKQVNLWTLEGRMNLSFVCGERQWNMLQHRKGESDLVLHRGKFFLLVTCDIEDLTPVETDKVLGIDLGIVNLATDSTGESFSGEQVEKQRQRYQKLRSALQSKGTKSAKRHLKKLSGKQKRFQHNINHVISKHIVQKAKALGCSLAVENLNGIRKTATVRKSQRAKHSNWSFYQLKQFLTYKAKMLGVKLFEVDPKYTSQKCSHCGHIEKRNRKSQSLFSCVSCGYTTHADYNAACNIAAKAIVNTPIVAAA
jgi:putative transposase